MGIINYFYRTLLKNKIENQLSNNLLKNNLESRINFLEKRLLDYHRNRWDAIDKLADYLVVAELNGEYCEFGVAQGKTFSYAVNLMNPIFINMRFFAFDSFKGLPEPRGRDIKDGYSGGFHEGEFSYNEGDFFSYLKSSNTIIDRVVAIKGWFHETLTPKTAIDNQINTISAAWIDCDLYESTVPVLKFLTDKLTVGSVILFDDWHSFRNLPDYGEQKACREWLADNPQITLNPFFSFGCHGETFTIGSC